MADEAPKPYEYPKGDQEFVFKDVASLPAWADKGWASWAQGPALAIPAGDVYSEGPYTTQTARVGDTVKFVAATPSKAAHFEIIPGEPAKVGAVTNKPPQASNASLEDMIKGGTLAPDDMSDEAKGQVISRSPKLKDIIEGDAPVAEPGELGVKMPA